MARNGHSNGHGPVVTLSDARKAVDAFLAKDSTPIDADTRLATLSDAKRAEMERRFLGWFGSAGHAHIARKKKAIAAKKPVARKKSAAKKKAFIRKKAAAKRSHR